MTLDEMIFAHARAQGARESCGLVVATPTGEQYFPCRNLAASDDRFDIDPADWIAAEAAGDLVALVHSHPEGPAVLSAADRFYQGITGLPWWLVVDGTVRKFRPVAPLLRRAWDHGRQDCLAIILDAYHLAGLELGQYQRADDWWQGDDDLYMQHLPAAGFERLAYGTPPQLGDVVTVCLGSVKATHAAVYLGNGYLLHHCPNRLSGRDLYGGYWQRQTHSIWRHTQWQQCDFTAISNDLVASTGLK